MAAFDLLAESCAAEGASGRACDRQVLQITFSPMAFSTVIQW